MKIVIVTGYGETIQGGIETYLNNLCIEFSKISSLDTHIVTMGNENNMVNNNGITIHFIKQTKIKMGKYIYAPWLIRKKILQIKPDIIHIQATFLAHNSIAVLSLIKKFPVILTVHGLLSIEMRFAKPSLKFLAKKNLELYIEKQLLRRIPYIIVPSLALKDTVFSVTKSKIYVVPNGVNLNEIRNNGKILQDIDSPSILFMGRLAEDKGVDVLLKATRIIKEHVFNIHVYIAGDGPEDNKLRNLANILKINDCVKFLGFIRGEEKWSYYKSVNICVVPSRDEPFGIVLLEAMACGKPIVASNIGGIPFLLENGKSGLLFESDNPDDLAAKIIFLLKNRELQDKMSVAGKEKAREFTWDKIAKKNIDLYNEAVIEKQT